MHATPVGESVPFVGGLCQSEEGVPFVSVLYGIITQCEGGPTLTNTTATSNHYWLTFCKGVQPSTAVVIMRGTNNFSRASGGVCMV